MIILKSDVSLVRTWGQARAQHATRQKISTFVHEDKFLDWEWLATRIKRYYEFRIYIHNQHDRIPHPSQFHMNRLILIFLPRRVHALRVSEIEYKAWGSVSMIISVFVFHDVQSLSKFIHFHILSRRVRASRAMR